LNYNKYSVRKRHNELLEKGPKNERKIMVAIFKLILCAFCFLVVVAAGAGFGMMKGILDDSPSIDGINIKPRGFKTVVYYEKTGKEADTLSTVNSNRILVSYDDISDNMKNAIVAIEDKRFWEHNGIDIHGIMRAGSRVITTGNADQGASTITQQLIKNHVFNVGMDEKTFLQSFERKVQEQYLAIELEKLYTKEQLLEDYLNTIYLGQGVNGVEAAAQTYFDKSCKALTISEAAVIASIPQNPYAYDPVYFPENNAERRELVLNEMLSQGYITQEQYDSAKRDDVYGRIAAVSEKQEEEASYNTYYMDALIFSLVDDFKELYGISTSEAFDEIYSGGYSIMSVQDPDIQKICDNIINDPDRYPDETTVAVNYLLTIVDPDGVTMHNYDTNTMLNYYRDLTGNYTYNNLYPDESYAKAATETYKEAMLEKTGGTFQAESFDTVIQPQASFTLIDQHTGYIKAMVGGRGEKRENLSYNRATDAERQPGSCFKILASFLPFIDRGGSLGYSFNDDEFAFENGTTVNNWYSGFWGRNTIRKAIEESMNIVAAKAITEVTPEVAFEYLLKEGFTTLVESEEINGQIFSDVQQATALGGLTYGITNLEITAAYAAIANMGTYIKPVYYSKVYDHDGNLVIDNTNPRASGRMRQVCRESTAWQLIQGMKDVVNVGTGGAARMQSGITCAGKTGTTSYDYDLWFCGMTPYYTAAIWKGYDSNMGQDGSAHKYMWRDIMDEIAEMEGQSDEADWERPDSITSVSLCSVTNQLPGPGCISVTDYIDEEFLPSTRCKGHETIVICNETNMIATDTCPDKKTYIVVTGDDGRKIIEGAKFSYSQDWFGIKTTDEEGNEKTSVNDKLYCTKHPATPKNFKVTTSSGPGGTITPTAEYKEKTSVMIVIAPDPGYMISDVLVDGVSIGQIAAYTFKSIDKDHTVSAVFSNGSGGAVSEPVAPPTTEAPVPEEPPSEAGEEEETGE